MFKFLLSLFLLVQPFCSDTDRIYAKIKHSRSMTHLCFQMIKSLCSDFCLLVVELLLSLFFLVQVNIFKKTLTKKTISLKVIPSDTIECVRTRVEYQERLPCNQHTLIFNETVLDESCTLFDFDINEGSILTLRRSSKGLMKTFVKTLRTEQLLTGSQKLTHHPGRENYGQL